LLESQTSRGNLTDGPRRAEECEREDSLGKNKGKACIVADFET
jgi:hypothetical protein